MHTLAYYLHDLDPFIFKIGTFGPRYYGVAYLLGFFFAYLLLKKQSRDGMLRLRPQLVPDFVLGACIAGILIGGRLGYLIFYDLPAALREGSTPLLFSFSSSVPFWGALRVYDGGMAAHGGVVFTILFLIWYGRRHKVSIINLGDASCMVVPIGLFFGRIANFINGELYGHPTTVPWAVKFPSEIYAGTNGKPFEQMPELQQETAAYIFEHAEKLSLPQVQAFVDHHPKIQADLMARFSTVDLDKSAVALEGARNAIAAHVRIMPDDIFASDFNAWWHGPHNAFTEFLATTFDKILPARHPSQLYQAFLEGLVLFVICYAIGRKWKKDGMASGAFLTLYPVMRIIGEQFRVGDTAVTGTLGAGVIYSIPMFAGGLIYWIYFIRKSKPNVWVPQADIPPDASPSAAAKT